MRKFIPEEILRGRPTVRIDDVENAHQTISELFCGHRLTPLSRSNSVRMRLRSQHRGDIGIEFLDYGEEVRIEPEGLNDFFLVQMPLAGRARMDVGRESVDSGPGVATVPPIDQPFAMTWTAGTPHLVVYARRAAVSGVADHLYGHGAGGSLRLGPAMNLDSGPGRAFLRSVREVHEELMAAGRDAPPLVHRLLQETMISRLLLAVENNAATSADVEMPAGAAATGRLVRRFRALLDRHATEELGVLDIAESLGVSLRTLQNVLRTELGRTPSELLLQARLDRCRTMLLASGPGGGTVTAIAVRCGFTHLGRFSASYSNAFGERPSETLRR